MPAEYTNFGIGGYNEIVQAEHGKTMPFGLPGLYESNLGGLGGIGGGVFELLDACEFWSVTGSSWLPDVAPATTSTTVLVPASRCPSNKRPYLLGWKMSVCGPVGWSATSPTNIPVATLQDTNGYPLAVVPWTDLGPWVEVVAGMAHPNKAAPMILGPGGTTNAIGTGTYSASTPSLTSSVTAFPTSASAVGLVGAPVQIIGGTGIGSTSTVKSNTATILTLNNAFQVAPGSNSVYAIYWQGLEANGSTTSQTLFPGTGTPFAANFFDSYWMSSLAGTGSGPNQSRQIIASTAAGVCTLGAALSTNFGATSVVSLNKNPSIGGVVDMACKPYAVTSLQSGLSLALSSAGGTSPVGSLLRVSLFGFWGP